MNWGRWIALNATVFIAAACIMTVEILSTRLAARYLGSSLYTWTSAIGVVLAGISLGNYLGGRLADRYHPRRTLALLFVLASLTCAAIPAANTAIGQWSALHELAWPTRIFLHFTLAFLLPAAVLGTMSPIVAKMALELGLGPGRTVGTIYAFGSIGSIVGTFVSGYFLVAELGTESAVLSVAAVLGVVGLIYGYRSWVPYAWTATFAAALLSAFTPWSGSEAFATTLGLRDPLEEFAVFKEDSQYQRVLVLERDPPTRTMLLDKLIHSTVNMEDPLDLGYEYGGAYAEIMRRAVPDGEPVAALFLGGGGYVLPRYVESTYPGSHIEVAEIDPVVTEAAYEALGLSRSSTVRCFDMDARNRVTDLLRAKHAGQDVPAFDFVLSDAFDDFSVPFHLTTLEFTEQIRELLTDEGVYVMNLIDSLESGSFLRAVEATCQQVFPHVDVFAASKDPQKRSTFIVVCSARDLDLASLPDDVADRHRGGACVFVDLGETEEGLVLTDDYAPVENLLAEVVSDFQGFVIKTTELVPSRDLVEVILRAQQMYENGRPGPAVPLFRSALAIDPDYPGLRHDLAVALFESGEVDEALETLRAAVEAEPASALLNERLGRMLAATDDLSGAVPAFERAVALDPADANARKNLALAHEKLGHDAEAVEQYRESLALLENLPVMNSLARLLAESDDGSVRDSSEALRWAELLGERTGGTNPEALETLAMALSASDRLPEAIEAAREASRLAEEAGLADVKRAVDARLADYVERNE
jgi:tetratricopeptide (TPR) repeat protein/spermidine synthase